MLEDGEKQRVRVSRPHDSGDFPKVVIPGSRVVSWGQEIVGKKEKKAKPTPCSGVGQRIAAPLTEMQRKMASAMRRKRSEEEEMEMEVEEIGDEEVEEDPMSEASESSQTISRTPFQPRQPRFIARPRQDDPPPVELPCFHPESFARGWSAVEGRQITVLAEELTRVPFDELYIGMSERSFLFDNLIQK